MTKRDKMSFIGKRTEVNMVAAAVRIAGGALRVAQFLDVSRSQVYRWINARSMARATYVYVAKLSNVSGIDMQLLAGEGSTLSNGAAMSTNGSEPRPKIKPEQIKPRRRQPREDAGVTARLALDGDTDTHREPAPGRIKTKLAICA